MDETKIFNELYSLSEDVDQIKLRLEDLPTRSEMNEKLDKILHVVQRTDQEKTVINFRLDEHDTRIEKLELETAKIN